MTKKKTKKKTNPAGRFLVLLILLLMLAALLAVKYFGIGPGAAPASDSVSDPSAPSETDSQGVAYLSGDEPDIPAETPTPTPPPTLPPATPEAIQEPIILENQGNIEIIIPEDMESEGF